MLIKQGQFVSCVKGKIGGHQISKNRSGLVLQTKSNRVRIKDKLPYGIRITIQRLYNEWIKLNNIIQSDWNRAAKLNKAFNTCGVAYNLSGQNLYIQLNLNRSLILKPSITLPPLRLPFFPITVTITTLDQSIPKFEINWQQNPVDNDYSTLIYTTIPISVGKNKNYKSFKLQSIIAGFAPGLINITTEYQTAHGFTWTKGMNISLKYLQIHEPSGYTNQGIIINKTSI